MTEALVAGAAVTLIAALFLFAFASLLKDQSIMDIAYGLVFVLLAWTLAYYFSALEVPMMLMLLAVSLWGVRLAARIFLKNYGKPEDFRYKHLRDKWSVGGKLNFYLKSLTDVFLLQGLIIFIVALPIMLLVGMNPAVAPSLSYLGLLVWAVGFVYEFTADMQLDLFIKNPANKGKIMDRGLFKFSRRPNYFGECLQWWGLAFFVSLMLPWPYMLIVFASPFLITYITTSVTGPMLERKWDDNLQYQEYKRRTSYFIPLPPKKA
jgi:steroid 5-alpha reductase family enzyme